MENKFDPTRTLFLIDGSTFLYRAYYSMRPLLTSKGIPVQAVYNFCRMIKKVIDTFNPHRMVLVWDSKGGSTQRKEMFQEYKAGRQTPPSDLFEQKKLIVEFANLIDLTQAEVPGIEADDIINTLVQQYKNDYKIVIIASDKDLYQLLDANTFIFDPFKEKVTNLQEYETSLGFSVDKLPFYFSLLGDTSDNIPGVKGIGKVTATELVKQFNNLNDLYENIDLIKKEKLKNNLLENRDNAFLSYQLFSLIFDETAKLDEQKLIFDPANWLNARPLFESLEFKSMIKDNQTSIFATKEIIHEAQATFFADEKGYIFQCVQTTEQLQELVEHLKNKKIFALDTEGSGLHPLTSEPVGLSFCAQKGLAFYVPFAHKTSEKQLTKEVVIKELKPILENSEYTKILQNAKYDQLVLYTMGIDLLGVKFDTMLAANLVLPDGQRVGLKYLSQHFLDEKMLSYDDVVKSKKLKDFSYVQLKEATNYSASDSHQTFVLKQILQDKLHELNLWKIFNEIEMPTSQILYKMELEGIYLDVNVLKTIGTKLSEDILKIESEIKILSDMNDLNINSPKQVGQLLFEKLNLPVGKKSPKGVYSTDQSVLEELSSLHMVPLLILKYRELYKLKSTYVESLPEYINHKTGRIHTTFSIVSTSTGRLSSFEPNLQNIPTDGSGYEIRSAFKPKNEHVFLSADYSQIELRILAHMSQDKNLLQAFTNNEDIHAKTAAYLFDVPINNVTNEQRSVGKRINFSVMYGLTPYGLSKDLKIPMRDAKIYIDKFFQQYLGVSAWMEKTIEHAKQHGYVETLFGRRRYVPGIYENNKTLYEIAKRAAINSPAQGTAADIMKIGMINLDKVLSIEVPEAKILLQIHDELLISVPKNKQKLAEKLTKEILESVVNWPIPLLVQTRFGNNWQEVTK